jgi:hypothetical protein
LELNNDVIVLDDELKSKFLAASSTQPPTILAPVGIPPFVRIECSDQMTYSTEKVNPVNETKIKETFGDAFPPDGAPCKLCVELFVLSLNLAIGRRKWY